MLDGTRFNRIDYSFEVVEGWKDDLVSSSDQADGRQQLQDQRLCPEEVKATGPTFKPATLLRSNSESSLKACQDLEGISILLMQDEVMTS